MSNLTVRKNTTTIAIHCAATRPSQDIGVDTIRKWHVDGNKWSDIGYHYVIKRDGTIETGRPDDTVGSGVKGFNSDTIHICLVGGLTEGGKSGKTFEEVFTDAQAVSLFHLIAYLEEKYPTITEVKGHRDFPNVAKDCPCFDVKTWLEDMIKV